MHMLVLSDQTTDMPDICCNVLLVWENLDILRITSIGGELTRKNGIEFSRPTFPYHFWKWISKLGITV